MKKRYFFKVLMNYSRRNNLDTEIGKLLNSYDALLIESPESLENFLNLLRSEIEKLHQEYSRCKEIELDIWSLSGTDQSVRCGSTDATIFNVEQRFEL